MKKLYTRFFHAAKHEKISEKVMLTRIATTITTIVVCLIAMSFTAYAYFSCDVSSASNVIQTASFDAQITITDKNGISVEPSSKNGKKTFFSFAVPGTYTVTLEKGSSSAQTGFCVIYVGNETYHTQQIGVDVLAKNRTRNDLTFTLQINESQTVVFESHWGTSSYYNYDNSNIVQSEPPKIIVVGTTADSVDDTNEEITTTVTTTTQTTTAEPIQTTATETTCVSVTTDITTTTETAATTETTVTTKTTTFGTATASVNITTEQTQSVSETTATDTGATTKGG